MTLRTFNSFCNLCSNFVTLNNSVILTVLKEYGLKQLGLENMWPLFVTEMQTNPGRLNCASCSNQTTEPLLRNVSNLRFIYWIPSRFNERHKCVWKDWNPWSSLQRRIVRCYNNHFTCAVKDHNNTCKWTYLDDLSVRVFKLSVITTSLQRRVVFHNSWAANTMWRKWLHGPRTDNMCK